MSESMDRPLTRGERLALGLHRAICSYCRRFGRQMQLLRRLVRTERAHDETSADANVPALSPEARERILRALVKSH